MRRSVFLFLAAAASLMLLASCGQGTVGGELPDQTPQGTVLFPEDPMQQGGEPQNPANTPDRPADPTDSGSAAEPPGNTGAAEGGQTAEPDPEPQPDPRPDPQPEQSEPLPSAEPSPEPSAGPSPSPEPTVSSEPSPSPEPEPSPEPTPSPEPEDSPYVDTAPLSGVDTSQEAGTLSQAPAAVPDLLIPEASGTLVKENSKAVIDYSHTEDGYVMVRYLAETTQRLKVQVKGPSATYTYNLKPGEWAVFPLSDGNGTYQVTVYQNVTESKYSAVLSLSCSVTLSDEFAPFLRPNQYVNYAAGDAAVVKAAQLTAGMTDPLKKVEAVYRFVVNALTYDREKAATVKSGYLPDLNQVMKAGEGICFDYAALMTAMLRSQGVPCKLVVGYAGTAYHAWISVWTAEHGWIDGVIYFDGSVWHRMDPTFASSADQSASILEYIGDGTNYTAKYLY